MSRPLRALSLAACFATPGAAALQESPLPAPGGRVVDDAELLSPAEESRLEEFLARLESETSVQLVLVSVPRIEGPIEDYALRLAEAWGIGQAATDNGALVVVSRDDRRARIEVGYGLEGAIPDGLAGRILREQLEPRFAGGDYAGGFSAAAVALAQAATGEYEGAGQTAPPEGRRGRRGFGTLVLVALLVGLQLLGYLGNAFHPGAAAALGGGGAALLGLLLFGVGSLFWLVPLGLLSGFGATAFTRAAAGRRSAWGFGGIPGGGGFVLGSSGFRGGFSGGFGGFSGGGGGFSGGGGGFGGGGASGSW